MKQSYRAARMERHHKRFGTGSLNLVSLMDIFTILVFFLLVNSSNVQQLPSSKAIKLPESSAQQMPTENIIVMVSNQQIFVQGIQVANVDRVMRSKEAVIPELYKEMTLKAQNSWQQNTADISIDGVKPGLQVTVMGDKKIPYKLLRKILATLSKANYSDISLAVMRNNKQEKAVR